MTILENFVVGDIFNPTTSLGAIFYGIVFLFLAILAGRTLRLGANQMLKRDSRALVDRTAVHFLTQLAQITVYLLALIFYAHLIPTLRSLGTAMLTGVSVVSVIIGLAAQNTLSNLIAGISLLLYRPFQVGDRVQVTVPTGLEIGTVESLTLGYTVLQTFDNRRIVVPNRVMATQVTINHTAVNPRQMVLIPISLSYTANIDRARQILLDLAQTHPLVQEVVNCPVTQLDTSSVNLSLRAWCANAGEAIQVESDLYEQAKKRFEQEGIEIPFPYTNIVLKKERQ